MLFVAPEAVPLAKTGGLGDVVRAAWRALQARGCDVTAPMPGYPEAIARLATGYLQPLRPDGNRRE